MNGFLADQDNQVVVLRTAEGQNVTVTRDEIEVLRPAGQSLMPEGLLKQLTDDQARDLFSYLRGTQPLAVED
jgi:putative heme-binding domain-containing protein